MMKLIEPDLEIEALLNAFRQDYLDAGEGAETCGALASCGSAREWCEKIAPYRDEGTTPEGRSPRRYSFLQREEDGKLVGFVQVRHPLREDCREFAGHLGYNVCPSERRKGYAARLLQEGVRLCRELGIEPALVCCDADNEASRRTILRCGGVLESTVLNPARNVDIERYLI